MNTLENRLLLRGREVAELIGASKGLVYKWMADGTLPTVRVGQRMVRVPREGLITFVEQHTQATQRQ